MKFPHILLATCLILFSTAALHAAPGYTIKIDKKWLDEALEAPPDKGETLWFDIKQSENPTPLSSVQTAMDALFIRFNTNARSVRKVGVSLHNLQWYTQAAKAQMSHSAYAELLRCIENNLSFLEHRFFLALSSLSLSGIPLFDNVNKLLTLRLGAISNITELTLSADIIDNFNKLYFPASLTSLTFSYKTIPKEIPTADIQKMLSRLKQLKHLSADISILPSLVKRLPNREKLTSVSMTDSDHLNNFTPLEEQLLLCPELREITINFSPCGYIMSRERFTRLDDLPLDVWLHRVFHDRPKPVKYPNLDDDVPDEFELDFSEGAYETAMEAPQEIPKTSTVTSGNVIKTTCQSIRDITLASASCEAMTQCLGKLLSCWPGYAFSICSTKKQLQFIQTVMAKLEDLTTWCDLAPQHDEIIAAIFQQFIDHIKDNLDSQFNLYLKLSQLLYHRPALLTNQGIIAVIGQLLSHILIVGASRTEEPANRYLEGTFLVTSIAHTKSIIENQELPFRGWIESFIETSFITTNYNGHEIYELCQKLFKTSLAPYIVAMYLRKIALIRQGAHLLSPEVEQHAFAIFANNVHWDNDAAHFTRSIEDFLAATQYYATDREGLESILNETVYPNKYSIKTILYSNLDAVPAAQLAANVDLIKALKPYLPERMVGVLRKIATPYLTAFAGPEGTEWCWMHAAKQGLSRSLIGMPDNQHAQHLVRMLADDPDTVYSDEEEETEAAELEQAMSSISLQPCQLSPRSRNTQVTTLCEQLQGKGKEFLLESIAKANIKILRCKMMQSWPRYRSLHPFAIIRMAQQYLHDKEIVAATTDYIRWLISCGGEEQPWVGLGRIEIDEDRNALSAFITALLAAEYQTFQLAAALQILYTLLTVDLQQEEPHEYCYFDDEQGSFFPLLKRALAAADASNDPTIIILRDLLKENDLTRHSWLLDAEERL